MNDHISIAFENVAKKVVARDEKLDFERPKRNAFKG
jgi:hypothetical protein